MKKTTKSHKESEEEVHHSSESELPDDEYYDNSDEEDTKEAQLESALQNVPLEEMLALRQKMPPKKISKRVEKGKRDKNAPAEMSTKRAVSRYRQVLPSEKPKSRDPRFDDLSGKLNEDLFNRSYGFIKELEDKDLDDIRLQIAKEKDVDEKERLVKLQQSILSQRRSKEAGQVRQNIKREWRKKQMEQVKQGAKPYFLKESDMKRLELVEKFKNTKGKNLDKILEKRRKKNQSKDRRYTAPKPSAKPSKE
jgi:ribosomal RNA-processing protein 36